MNIDNDKAMKTLRNNLQKLTALKMLASLVVLVVMAGCSAEGRSDAYGQFEATETTISSEARGKLLRFGVEEGQELKPGQQVGVIDTARLVLQRKELQARLQSVESRITNINAQVDVRQAELENALADRKRYRALVEDSAATRKQLDDVQSRVRVIRRQIDALKTQKSSVRAEVNAVRAQIAQLEDQIAESRIVNPLRGRVLTTFVEPFEIVQAGQPLYRIADLDTLVLRVYVSGAQLPHVKLGQEVQVLVDKNAEENQSLSGRVSWIASEAEFTPQQIQTKQERVTQVYAVKVRVPNPNGILKIGMPGEVNF